MNATIVTVGEALTDIVIRLGSDPVEYPGGSPMNVAVALGRLGYESHLLTDIGDDDRGVRIREHIEHSRVQLTQRSVKAGARTSTAEATIGADGAASYEFAIAWDPDSSDLPHGVQFVHSSSIAATLEPGAETVRDVVSNLRESALISYDPNARPSLMGDPDLTRPIVEQNIALADVVKASDEDLEWLYPGRPIEDVARSFLDSGVALAVITRGGDGATAFSASGQVDVPGVSVDIADTVGAGDTFSAGLIDALVRRGFVGAQQRDELQTLSAPTITEILNHAAKLAAVTVSRAGANPPWDHEINA